MNNRPPQRNPMTADTEPTDEELELVMRAACQTAIQRKRASEVEMRRRLAEAVASAKGRFR